MDMEKIITFIIPAYNVEKYLDKCLRSFLEMSVLEQIEVLIVNDGSTDNTEIIARTYIEKYPTSYRILNKINGGHGSVINEGSLAAKGKFFKVIDADDWVITSNLPAFINRLKQCNADMILTPFHWVDLKSGKRKEQAVDIPIPSSVINMKEITENWGGYEQCMVFHCITYRTDFYKTYFHILPEHIFYEDQEYSSIPACHAENIEYWDIYIYQYMIGNVDQSVSFSKQAERMKHLEIVSKNILSYYNCHKSKLSQGAREYLLLKAENIILMCYTVAGIYEQDRKKGKRELKTFNASIARINIFLYRKLWRKYQFYLAMNCLHMHPNIYTMMVESNIYGKIKKRLLQRKTQ